MKIVTGTDREPLLVECAAGHRFSWPDTAEIGRNEFPLDWDSCNCRADGGPHHSADCEAWPYALVHKNCPECATTLSHRLIEGRSARRG